MIGYSNLELLHPNVPNKEAGKFGISASHRCYILRDTGVRVAHQVLDEASQVLGVPQARRLIP